MRSEPTARRTRVPKTVPNNLDMRDPRQLLDRLPSWVTSSKTVMEAIQREAEDDDYDADELRKLTELRERRRQEEQRRLEELRKEIENFDPIKVVDRIREDAPVERNLIKIKSVPVERDKIKVAPPKTAEDQRKREVRLAKKAATLSSKKRIAYAEALKIVTETTAVRSKRRTAEQMAAERRSPTQGKQ